MKAQTKVASAAPAAPAAPDLKALADGLAQHETVIQEVLDQLQGAQYDDTRKILHSALDNVKSTHTLLDVFAARPGDSTTMTALDQCRAHVLTLVSLLVDIDLNMLPPDVADKVRALKRARGTWAAEVASLTVKAAQVADGRGAGRREGDMPPGPPTALTCAPDIRQVRVTWGPPTPADPSISGYLISYSQGSTLSANPETLLVGAATTDTIVDDLQNGAEYTFTVAAINRCGPGDACAPRSTTLPDVPGPPTIITPLKPDAGQVTIGWNQGSQDPAYPTTSYVITYWDGPVVNTVLVDAATSAKSVPPNTVTIAGLTNGAVYTFTMAAVNAVGQSSPAQQVTVELPGVPAAPAKPSLDPGDGQVTVSWTAPADGGSPITGYIVTSSGPGTADTARVDGATTSALIDDLDNAGVYSFTVAAINNVGVGPTSPPASITLPVTQPAIDCSSMQNIDDLKNAAVSLLAAAQNPNTTLTDWLTSFVMHLGCAQQLLDENDPGIDPATDQRTVREMTAAWQQAIFVFQGRASRELATDPANTATYAMAAIQFETLLSAVYGQLEKIMAQSDLIGSRS